MAKVNIKELRKRQKYIKEQKHDTLQLFIWNYTPECQFAKAWDKYTLMSRGLITDKDGNIYARPFKKFFNYGQDSTQTLPTDMPIISEKMDGSLGIQYYDAGGEVYIATRGSFGSDQAQWATKWIRTRGLKQKDFVPNKTYLYEIIYKENRVVVDYGQREELVLLAVIDNQTGDETFVKDIEAEAKRLGLSYAKRIKASGVDEILKLKDKLTGNEEGYVFHWSQHKNLRLKMKGTEYVRLHRLLTEFSNISIWAN
jgi:RNA ligase